MLDHVSPLARVRLSFPRLALSDALAARAGALPRRETRRDAHDALRSPPDRGRRLTASLPSRLPSCRAPAPAAIGLANLGARSTGAIGASAARRSAITASHLGHGRGPCLAPGLPGEPGDKTGELGRLTIPSISHTQRHCTLCSHWHRCHLVSLQARVGSDVLTAAECCENHACGSEGTT